MLVKLDVAVGDARDDFGGHFGYLLSGLSLETVVHQPFADKFLGQLFLFFPASKAFFVAVGVEVAGRVGGVDFVDEVNLPVLFPELVFGVNEDKSFAGCYFRSPLEEGVGVFLEQFVIFFGY